MVPVPESRLKDFWQRVKRWHSAPWWAGAGGLFAGIALLIGAGQWLFPMGQGTSGSTAGPTQPPKIAAIALVITSQTSAMDGTTFVYTFRGRANTPLEDNDEIHIVAVPAGRSNTGQGDEQVWRVSPAALFSADGSWSVIWRTTESLEGVQIYAIVWRAPLPEPASCPTDHPYPITNWDRCGVTGLSEKQAEAQAAQDRVRYEQSIIRAIEYDLDSDGIAFYDESYSSSAATSVTG